MWKRMHIAVGSDHRGHAMRLRLIECIQQAGHVVEDVGTHEHVPVDYADIASIVAGKVSCGEVDRGILGVWLTAPLEGGRHARCVRRIAEIERGKSLELC